MATRISWQYIVIAAILFIGLASIIISVASQPSAGDSSQKSAQPAAESSFLDAKIEIQSQYDNAPNDMVKHRIAQAWQNGGSCASLKSNAFSGWLGTISQINYKGDVAIDLGNDVTLESTVDATSHIGQEVMALQEGDSVRVSGVFEPQLIARVANGDPRQCQAPPISDEVFDLDTGTVTKPSFNVRLLQVSQI